MALSIGYGIKVSRSTMKSLPQQRTTAIDLQQLSKHWSVVAGFSIVVKCMALHIIPNVALCSVGLLPFLINNLRNPSLQCKAAALHVVALTLSAQIGPPLVEAAHVSSPYTCATISDPQMSSNSTKAQTFIARSFAALEEVLRSETSGD